jgi:hypothetical protein
MLINSFHSNATPTLREAPVEFFSCFAKFSLYIVQKFNDEVKQERLKRTYFICNTDMMNIVLNTNENSLCLYKQA